METPGRMVIMSTNHHQLLDPALIRPGRIDRIMELGYMLPKDCMDMLEHYYQRTLSDEQKQHIEYAIAGQGAKITPAEIEQFVMQDDTVNDCIVSLQRRGEDFGSSSSTTERTSSSTADSCILAEEQDSTDIAAVSSKEDQDRLERIKADAIAFEQGTMDLFPLFHNSK